MKQIFTPAVLIGCRRWNISNIEGTRVINLDFRDRNVHKKRKR